MQNTGLKRKGIAMNCEYRCAASSLTLDDDHERINRTISTVEERRLLWEREIEKREEGQKRIRALQYARQLADKEISFQQFAEAILDMV